MAQINEHMQVVGSDGQHVGTVDHLDGDTSIKLTKNDTDAGGQHHWLPLAWVDHVDQVVHLNKPAQEAMQQWLSSAPGSSERTV